MKLWGKNGLVLCATLLALAGCKAQPPSDETLMDVKVVKVGKTHLIVDDGKSVMFVTIDDVDKDSLKKLKKGDKITLVSKKEPGSKNVEDILEIITLDGSHIPLGG